MTPAEAAAILIAMGSDHIGEDYVGGPDSGFPYFSAELPASCLDGDFDASQLRAIAEWMDHPAEVAAEAKRLREGKA